MLESQDRRGAGADVIFIGVDLEAPGATGQGFVVGVLQYKCVNGGCFIYFFTVTVETEGQIACRELLSGVVERISISMISVGLHAGGPCRGCWRIPAKSASGVHIG